MMRLRVKSLLSKGSTLKPATSFGKIDLGLLGIILRLINGSMAKLLSIKLKANPILGVFKTKIGVFFIPIWGYNFTKKRFNLYGNNEI